jgi:hypothetical protein
MIMSRAVHKSNCFHKNGHGADCGVYDATYMVAFGMVQIFISQLPNLHDLSWLSCWIDPNGRPTARDSVSGLLDPAP